MKVEKTIDINASREAIWDVIGTRFADAHEWASPVDRSSSSAGAHAIAGAPTNGRTCETSIGMIRENLLTYDEDAKQLSYEAFSDQLPSFVKGLVAIWRLSDGPGNTSRVHMTLNVDIAPPFNVLMGLMMKLKMGGIAMTTIKDLKHYVETGEPSDEKKEAALKYEKKSARKAAA